MLDCHQIGLESILQEKGGSRADDVCSIIRVPVPGTLYRHAEIGSHISKRHVDFST